MGATTVALASPQDPKNPKIYHVTTVLANTEYSQTLTPGTKAVGIKITGNATLKLYFAPAAVDSITVYPNDEWFRDKINFTGTLYFKSDRAGKIVEIEEWT